MNHVTKNILAVYVIVYLCLSILKKPNYEFFLASNQIPNEPRFVTAQFKNGGIAVSWTRPRQTEVITYYKIYVEDVRNTNNKHEVEVRPNSESSPNQIIRNAQITGDRQYKVFMRAFNNNGRSSSSNVVYTGVSGETSLGNGTQRAVEEELRRFKEQEAEQNIQNREISNLKKRVDVLRSDIVILKNKEKEENRSVHNTVDIEDSISQLPASVRDRYGLNLPSEIDFNFTIDPTL